MSDKRLTGRRVYEPTGEVRPPRSGEHYLSVSGEIHLGQWEGDRTILRLVEDFREQRRNPPRVHGVFYLVPIERLLCARSERGGCHGERVLL